MGMYKFYMGFNGYIDTFDCQEATHGMIFPQKWPGHCFFAMVNPSHDGNFHRKTIGKWWFNGI